MITDRTETPDSESVRSNIHWMRKAISLGESPSDGVVLSAASQLEELLAELTQRESVAVALALEGAAKVCKEHASAIAGHKTTHHWQAAQAAAKCGAINSCATAILALSAPELSAEAQETIEYANNWRKAIADEHEAAAREPVAEWEDHNVQVVYAILCDTKAPPESSEHWEGWLARRIIAALHLDSAEARRVVEDAERWNNIALLWIAYAEVTLRQDETGFWSINCSEGIEFADTMFVGADPNATIDAIKGTVFPGI